MSGTISVTKDFLDAFLQRGVEKGVKEGYQKGLEDGKQKAMQDHEDALADVHAQGVANGLLWGLNCPQSFRLHWERTGQLSDEMPASVIRIEPQLVITTVYITT